MGYCFSQKFGVLNGKYSDFVTDWYTSGGVYVTTLMLLNTVIPLIGPVAVWAITRVKRHRALQNQVRCCDARCADVVVLEFDEAEHFRHERIWCCFLILVSELLCPQDVTTVVTQDEMNRLFVGPPFELETRYTEVNIACITRRFNWRASSFALSCRFW